MGLPEHDGGRPATERPRNVISTAASVAIADAIPRDSDPWCCGSYGIDELRLGFGCPRHTVGPL